MDKQCPAGAFSYPGGLIPFGPGHPVLCVNDQCGYLVEKPEVIDELRAGCFDSLIALARAGLERGMPVFDLQLDEPRLADRIGELYPAALQAVYEATGCCIGVDVRDPALVEQALAMYPHKAMCNTVTGQWENLEVMLPIIARYGAGIGCALVYEKGIPQTVAERVAVARRIVEAAEGHGISRQDVIVDAVCLPASVMPDSMRVTLESIRAIREELGVPVLVGVSNAGFMMPNPRYLDLAYFVSCVAWGLDVAMVDPETPLLDWVGPAMDFLMGSDPRARLYLNRYRASQGRPSLEDRRITT